MKLACNHVLHAPAAAVANGSTEQGKAESTQETLERARERGEKELKALEEVVKRGRSEKDKLASRWRSIEDWASRDSADAVNGQKDGNENASIDWNSGFPEGCAPFALEVSAVVRDKFLLMITFFFFWRCVQNW